MSDELDVRAKVTLEADEAASVKQIKSQIPNIESGLKGTRVKVQLDADAAKASQDINDAIKQATGSLKTGGKAVIPIDIKTKINEKEATKLRKLILDIQNLQTKLTKSNVTLDWTKVNDSLSVGKLDMAREYLTILNKEYRNLNTELSAKLPNQAIENLPKSINEAITSVSLLSDKFKGLKTQGFDIPTDSITKLTDLSTKLKTLSAAPMDESVLAQFRSITAEIDKFGNDYKRIASLVRSEKLDIGAENIQIDIQKIRSNLVSMQKDWSAAMKNPAFVQRFKEMFAVIDSGTIKSGAQLTNFRKEVQRLSADIQAAGLDQKTLWGRLTQNLQKFTSWFLIGGGVASAVRGLRDMVSAVKAIDLSMTELRKVTDETNSTYEKFLKNAAKRSVELATNLSDYVGSAADFARMGFSIPDATALADASTIYYNVADGMDSMEQATQSIISTLKAYRLEASDATKVTDIFNEISNRFAVTSGGIGEGMQRAGAALATANTSLEKSVALWTAMNEVIQNDESSATSLRFIAQRMRNTAGELEDMGEDADGAAESITKLQQQIRELTGVDIMSDANNFRDVYDVLKDISGVWDDITDKDRADVIRLMAGTRQSAAFSALMQNFSSAESALQVALESSGSAYKENLKWLDSIEAKQQKAQAAFQAFSNEILSSDLVKFTYDAETGILGFLTNLISSLDAIPVLATAAAAALSFKNVGQPKCRAAVGLPRQILHKRCTFLDVGTTRFKIKREAPTFCWCPG